MTQWICTLCYHEQETDGTPLESCTQCGADARSIIPLKGDASDADRSDFTGLPEDLDQLRECTRKKLKR